MKFLRLLLVPFALLVVLLSRCGLPIRFGRIWSDRIGHMAGNMECYLCERDAGLSTGWDFWYHGAEPASQQLAKMLARVIRICNPDSTGGQKIDGLACGDRNSGDIRARYSVLLPRYFRGGNSNITHDIFPLRPHGSPGGLDV